MPKVGSFFVSLFIKCEIVLIIDELQNILDIHKVCVKNQSFSKGRSTVISKATKIFIIFLAKVAPKSVLHSEKVAQKKNVNVFIIKRL